MRRIPALCLLLVPLLPSACNTELRQRDWSQDRSADPAVFSDEETPFPVFHDPVEPMNRGVSGFNHGFVVGLVTPLATGWSFIMPRPVREGIGNIFENFRWPVRLFGNLLQGMWGGAGRETARFGINTTVGLLGIFDPASAWGIEPSDEDVGRAFRSWGWEESSYLVIPFMGPSTSRDATAMPFDMLLDPATYLLGGSAFRGLNEGTDYLDQYYQFVHTNYDPYAKGRMLWVLTRHADDKAMEFVPTEDPAVETIGAVYLANRDPDFPDEASRRDVVAPATGLDLTYDLFLQDDPAPVLFVIPGLGGHRESSSALGLAEMAWNRGFSVVTISSAMNWEFIQQAASGPVPGYAPVDAEDVHGVLDAIWDDLDAAYGDRITGKALMGMSLGAFHTLFIAAAEGTSDRVAFDRYVAINPPVRFERGMEKLDAYFNTPMRFPEHMRLPWVDGVLDKAVSLYKQGELEPGVLLPFTKTEAEYLIGLAFRVTLVELILSGQDREDLGVLLTERSSMNRTSAYREIREYSFAEYLHAFAFPYYRERDSSIASPADLLERCDLRRHEAALTRNDKVRVFTNADDFLLAPEDVGWLRGVVGDGDFVLEEKGGHLGNLHEKEVQERIMEFLADVAPAR
ncbi:MAG: MlaA family lipoprotein [Planctomycetota bacterium JB042]